MKYQMLVCFVFTTGIFSVSAVSAQDNPMGFFVTSTGSGKGGDLGGQEGAD